MFSDRLWILKVALALGALGFLGTQARKALEETQPDIERVAVFSEQLKDHTLYVSNKTVVGTDSTGLRIQTDVGPMHLQTPQRAAVGDIVSALARPIGPRRMEVIRLQVNEGFRWKRGLNYAVSVLTVLAYLWLIRHRFRWNPSAGFLRSRY